ncbi:hypothetical protein C8F04DRAFT_1069278 [Mycena alexandri]|uniref:Uncharacterized protein n=1 Tax=Mycena alexandri TaxID=1745969 RepID=A0AAD6TEW8_9AGAR|nr:hypothetical protein C8F04DRAFT_1069278 [Mycena alexandri]
MDETLRWFLKWLDIWRDALFAWAAFSANLANHPADYVLNHRSDYLDGLFIGYDGLNRAHCTATLLKSSGCLQQKPRNTQRAPNIWSVDRQSHPICANTAQATLGGMRTDAQMRQEFNRLTDLAYRAQIVESFNRVAPAPRKLRVVIVCYPLYSVAGDDLWNIFPDHKAAAFSNPFSSESRLLSTALEHAWREQFAEHVRKGNVTGHKEVLQKLIQESQVLAKVAFEVD